MDAAVQMAEILIFGPRGRPQPPSLAPEAAESIHQAIMERQGWNAHAPYSRWERRNAWHEAGSAASEDWWGEEAEGQWG